MLARAITKITRRALSTSSPMPSEVLGLENVNPDTKDDLEETKSGGVTDPKQLVITKEAPKVVAKPNKKIALVVGACHGVGYEAGLSLLRRFPQSSRIYLTSKHKEEEKLNELQDKFSKYVVDKKILDGENISDPTKITFVHLDLYDNSSLVKLYRKIKEDAMTLDILINNAQKYFPPNLLNEEVYMKQCHETLQINYWGMKAVCKSFSPLMHQGGRIVNCTSHLGHLSNIDGREPLASKLRNKFVDAKLTEDELDKLIKQFANFAKEGGSSGVWNNGWCVCPYTVSKIAVNTYTRLLQSRLDQYHGDKDLVVNAVHHGHMHPMMNATSGFSELQAGELVAGMAVLPEKTTSRGKIYWRDLQSCDNWEYGGLDDDNRQSKATTSIYNMVQSNSYPQDINYGSCLTG